MHQFSIRDIEQLCGIKAHTLRAWEQRYNLGVQNRPDGQHRVYSNEELKDWLRIAFLYHNGYKISAIAALDSSGMQALLQAYYDKDSRDESYIHRLVEACLDFNKEQFEEIVQAVVERNGIEHCILQIFYPYLHRIGLLWLTNHAIPAQEHFASHIIRKKIISATDALTAPLPGKKSVLLFAPAGEFHEIPLLTANYFFRKAGLRTVYFGVNVSSQALRCYLDQHKTDFIHTHVITCLNTENPELYLDELREMYKGPILRSGKTFRSLLETAPNEIRLHNPAELRSYAEKIAAD